MNRPGPFEPGLLLMDGLRRSSTLRQQLGIVAVIVDARDERARGFYERYGFRRFGGDERRRFILMATITRLELSGSVRGAGTPPGEEVPRSQGHLL